MKVEDEPTRALFERLVRQLALVAPEATRAIEAETDRRVAAELSRRSDAVEAATLLLREDDGAADALARHRRAVRATLAAELFASRGGAIAAEALVELASRHCKPGALDETGFAVLRVLQQKLLGVEIVERLLSARLALEARRAVLARIPPFQRELGAEGVERAFGERLRSIDASAEQADVALEVYRGLLCAGEESKAVVLARAALNPHPEAPAVRAILEDVKHDAELEALLARVARPDAWRILEALLADWNSWDAFDLAFASGETAHRFASPGELLSAMRRWADHERETAPVEQSATFLSACPGGLRFNVLSGGRTGLEDLYHRTSLARTGDGAALAQATTHRFLLGGAPLYVVHCFVWSEPSEHNRVSVQAARTPRLEARALAGLPDEGAGWVARNEAALSALRSGPYRAVTLELSLCASSRPPFVAEDAEPSAARDEDLDLGPLPEAVEHFAAALRWNAKTTEVALLPSGVLVDEAPVAYVWRAPEELALASLPPESSTKIWGVLLQGEATVKLAVERGERVRVVFLLPLAWAGAEERVTEALGLRTTE